uniref:Uncharacterized protein n=1 Tax=Arundo donax TaxID=35708 RepID=A0A0A9HR51_ARUDO
MYAPCSGYGVIPSICTKVSIAASGIVCDHYV